MDELSAKWADLTDIQQASITELIAGKRQGNIVSALMSNFDIARGSLDTALNGSAGSAERELSNYQKGIEFSLDKIKSSFQDFSNTLVSSDLVKGVVDFGTLLLEKLNSAIEGGAFKVLAGGFGFVQGLKGGGESIVQSHDFLKDLCHRVV